MSNPASLKPFKKGKDPRRKPKRKGCVSYKTKIKGFIDYLYDYYRRHGKEPSEEIDEMVRRLETMTKKDFKALQYFLDRIFGKQPDKLDVNKEEIQELTAIFRKMAEKKQ